MRGHQAAMVRMEAVQRFGVLVQRRCVDFDLRAERALEPLLPPGLEPLERASLAALRAAGHTVRQ